MKNNKRIVVTGIGPIASVGIGKEEFWKGLLQLNKSVRKVQACIDEQIWEEYYFHQVANFNIEKFNIEEAAIRAISQWKEGENNKDLHYLLVACKLALDDSNIIYDRDNNDLGLVVCHENPCIEQLLWKSFELSYKYLTSKTLRKRDYFESIYSDVMKLSFETQSFMALFHVARTFRIHNFSLYVNNACASGLYGLDVASDMIRLGKASKVIVVASDCPDVFKHIWFKKLNMYANDGLTKPFSKAANGFVLGESAAALILESYDEAVARNAKIYAEYLGAGFRLESWGVTTPRVGYKYYHEAIEQSLINSNVERGAVDLICAHGVGTHISDCYEAKAFDEVFQESKPLVTAFKPYIGHCLGTSNLIELIILLLCIENQTIIPIRNLNQINPKINLNLATEQQKYKINIAVKTCSAFAGFCAASIFKRIV
jgi:3-oxoacyl-(acyl-carrier-protein) synthase